MRLRRAVEVRRTESGLRLRYGFWDIALQARIEREFPSIWSSVISGDVLPANLDEGGRRIVQWFDTLGFLTHPTPSADVQFRDLRARFLGMASGFYGQYYRHPLWERILGGDRDCLVNWLRHNYGLSVCVGRTAARGAANPCDPRAREIFLKNTIEEYDHFSRYFQRLPASFELSREDLIGSVPSTSTRCFELGMLRAAESDWLAHALVAWMQEHTASFSEYSKVFFQEAENANPRTAGLFRPFIEHLSFDKAHGHATDFESLLDRDEVLDVGSLGRTLRLVGAIAQTLIDALWECLPEAPTRCAVPPTSADLHWLRRSVRDTVTVALSNATDPGQILRLGAVLELLATTEPGSAAAPIPDDPRAEFLAQQLRELARAPADFEASLVQIQPFLNRAAGSAGIESHQQGSSPAVLSDLVSYWVRPISQAVPSPFEW